MKPEEWLKQYRMIGNTLIKEGEWAVEVLADKKAIGKDVKDRLKEGIAQYEKDDLTETVSVYIEKAPKYLANTTFFEQVDTLLNLYDEATGNSSSKTIMPPWYECTRVKLTKENVSDVLKGTETYLKSIKPEYAAAWDKAVPKEMTFYHQKIQEGVCTVLEYLAEKYKEIADGDNKRATQAPTLRQPSQF